MSAADDYRYLAELSTWNIDDEPAKALAEIEALRARVAELEAASIHLSEALRVARADAAAKAHRCRELDAILDYIRERIDGIIDPERPPYGIPAPSPRGPDPGNPNEAGQAPPDGA